MSFSVSQTTQLGLPLSEVSFAAKVINSVRRFLRRPSLSFLPFDPNQNLGTWDLRGSVARTQRVFTLEVRNAGDLATRCIAFLEVWPSSEGKGRAKLYPLHWADTEYAYRTSGADPIDIGPEGRRVDVLFTFAGQPVPGCWVGTNAALVAPIPSGDYLAPGEYEAEVQVTATNAKPVKARFRVHSPQAWDSLEIRPL